MCLIQLKREPRFGYSARKIHIYVNGTPNCSVKNGATCLLSLSPGKHELSFFMGKNLLTDVMLSIDENTENFGIVFWITNTGEIEVKLTNNNIDYNINQKKTSTTTYIILALTLVFLLLVLLRFSITPVVYLFSIS